MNLKMVILKALTSYILFKTCWFGSHSVFSRYLSNRRFDFFFISALNIINVTSPVSVDREPEFIKWRTNENRVRTSFALSTWQHNVWRGGMILCLWKNNTGSFETEELWFHSSSADSHEPLPAIDVCSNQHCYSTSNSGTRGRQLLKKKKKKNNSKRHILDDSMVTRTSSHSLFSTNEPVSPSAATR